MREIRTSGSEGGVAQSNALSLPLYIFLQYLDSRLHGNDRIDGIPDARSHVL